MPLLLIIPIQSHNPGAGGENSQELGFALHLNIFIFMEINKRLSGNGSISRLWLKLNRSWKTEIKVIKLRQHPAVSTHRLTDIWPLITPTQLSILSQQTQWHRVSPIYAQCQFALRQKNLKKLKHLLCPVCVDCVDYLPACNTTLCYPQHPGLNIRHWLLFSVYTLDIQYEGVGYRINHHWLSL